MKTAVVKVCEACTLLEEWRCVEVDACWFAVMEFRLRFGLEGSSERAPTRISVVAKSGSRFRLMGPHLPTGV